MLSRKCFALVCADVGVLQKEEHHLKRKTRDFLIILATTLLFDSLVFECDILLFVGAVRPLPSFTLPLITRTPFDHGGEKIRSKSRMHGIADHRHPSAKATLASKCRVLAGAPPFVPCCNLSAAYLFIGLTVGADRRETGGNVPCSCLHPQKYPRVKKKT